MDIKRCARQALQQRTNRRWRRLLAAGAVCAAVALAGPAQAAPANTLQELLHNLDTCLAAASGAPGEEITLRFSLRRDGALLGKPRITFAKHPRDSFAQQHFVESVAIAFGHCLPTPITDTLGAAVAGRPLTFRLGVKARETDI